MKSFFKSVGKGFAKIFVSSLAESTVQTLNNQIQPYMENEVIPYSSDFAIQQMQGMLDKMKFYLMKLKRQAILTPGEVDDSLFITSFSMLKEFQRQLDRTIQEIEQS